MIVVNGVEYRKLKDEIFVNGVKVYNVHVNGVKVYPEGYGDTMYLIDTSGSSSGRQDTVVDIVENFIFGSSFMLGSWTIDGQHCKVLHEWTKNFEDILDAIRASSLNGGNGAYDTDPTDVIVNEFETYQPNTIVVIGDYELTITDDGKRAIDGLIGAANLYMINIGHAGEDWFEIG